MTDSATNGPLRVRIIPAAPWRIIQTLYTVGLVVAGLWPMVNGGGRSLSYLATYLLSVAVLGWLTSQFYRYIDVFPDRIHAVSIFRSRWVSRDDILGYYTKWGGERLLLVLKDGQKPLSVPWTSGPLLAMLTEELGIPPPACSPAAWRRSLRRRLDSTGNRRTERVRLTHPPPQLSPTFLLAPQLEGAAIAETSDAATEDSGRAPDPSTSRLRVASLVLLVVLTPLLLLLAFSALTREPTATIARAQVSSGREYSTNAFAEGATSRDITCPSVLSANDDSDPSCGGALESARYEATLAIVLAAATTAGAVIIVASRRAQRRLPEAQPDDDEVVEIPSAPDGQRGSSAGIDTTTASTGSSR